MLGDIAQVAAVYIGDVDIRVRRVVEPGGEGQLLAVGRKGRRGDRAAACFRSKK
jgi:hypothetical protein